MNFRNLERGQVKSWKLRQLLKSGKLSHAYIFEGGSEAERRLAAREFAKTVFCAEPVGGNACGECISCVKIAHDNHEDLIYVERDGNSVGVKQVEELQRRLKNKPYISDRIIAVITDADRLTAQSQNKLLKTLEEPNPGDIIILLSENPENLLITIRSRCVSFHFSSEKEVFFSDREKKAEEIVDSLVDGRPFHETSALLGDFAGSRDESVELLDVMELWCRDLMMASYSETLIWQKEHLNEIREVSARSRKFDVDRLISCIEGARKDINGGVNANYSLKDMILRFAALRGKRRNLND
ncbi:MAG: hypothetical protein LBT34_03540 [Clostridiales Family XIII bacterium]|jgi:DNA polymerase-3 subunit delta'|nr:hypothetical protein [Clostridiales Family XIII bacterium]